MTEKAWTRLYRATVLDKNEKCINSIHFSEPAKTDITPASVKEYLLSKPNTTYSCSMCKGVHDLKEASFASQGRTLWDGIAFKSPDAGLTPFYEKLGEDEFKIHMVVKGVPNGRYCTHRLS